MDVIQMFFQIYIILDDVFPKTHLPDRGFPSTRALWELAMGLFYTKLFPRVCKWYVFPWRTHGTPLSHKDARGAPVE